MKRDRVTDDFYQQAEHIIYNDLPTDVLYHVSKTMDYFREEIVQQIILPKEKWVRVYTKDGRGDCAYTSYGRLINTKTVHILSPSITRINILHTFSGNGFRSSDIFKQNGWEHNIEELVQRYADKGWKVTYNHYNKL